MLFFCFYNIIMHVIIGRQKRKAEMYSIWWMKEPTLMRREHNKTVNIIIHFRTSKRPEHILIIFWIYQNIIIYFIIIILESKKKVEKKRCRRCRVSPKVSIIKVKYKKVWGEPLQLLNPFIHHFLLYILIARCWLLFIPYHL